MGLTLYPSKKWLNERRESRVLKDSTILSQNINIPLPPRPTRQENAMGLKERNVQRSKIK